MRKLIAALAILLPLAAGAQTYTDLDLDFRGRTSVAVDYKVFKGFHISLEEEIRMKDNFGGLDRFQTTVGVSYKIAPWLKAGLGYSFIEKQGNTELKPRHRVNADLTGIWKTGDWTFSLRERFLLTNRPGSFNRFENPRNALALKSRFQVKYRLTHDLRPYALFELRTALNDVQINATYSSNTDKYTLTNPGADPNYNIINNNRYRAGIGLEWKLGRNHALDFYGLGDYCMERDPDFSKNGKELNSFTIDRSLNITAGVGYVFSF